MNKKKILSSLALTLAISASLVGTVSFNDNVYATVSETSNLNIDVKSQDKTVTTTLTDTFKINIDRTSVRKPRDIIIPLEATLDKTVTGATGYFLDKVKENMTDDDRVYVVFGYRNHLYDSLTQGKFIRKNEMDKLITKVKDTTPYTKTSTDSVTLDRVVERLKTDVDKSHSVIILPVASYENARNYSQLGTIFKKFEEFSNDINSVSKFTPVVIKDKEYNKDVHFGLSSPVKTSLTYISNDDYEKVFSKIEAETRVVESVAEHNVDVKIDPKLDIESLKLIRKGEAENLLTKINKETGHITAKFTPKLSDKDTEFQLVTTVKSDGKPFTYKANITANNESVLTRTKDVNFAVVTKAVNPVGAVTPKTVEDFKPYLLNHKYVKSVEVLGNFDFSREVDEAKVPAKVTFLNGNSDKVDLVYKVVDSHKITPIKQSFYKGDSKPKDYTKLFSDSESILSVEPLKDFDISSVKDSDNALLKVTFKDKSSKNIYVPYEVKDKVEASIITPVPSVEAIKQSFYKGDNKPEDYKTLFKDSSNIKEVTAVEDFDTSTVGADKEAKVKVVFKDESSKIAKVPYEVKDKVEASIITPVPSIEAVKQSFYKGDNKPEDYKTLFKDSSNIKEVTAVEDFDTSTVGADKEAKVKVVFKDESSKIAKVPYEVKDKIIASIITPVPSVEAIKQSFYKGDSKPEDYKALFKDSSNINEITAVEDFDTSTVGAEKEAKVKVIFKDGSSKVAKVPYEVKDKITASVITPVPSIEAVKQSFYKGDDKPKDYKTLFKDSSNIKEVTAIEDFDTSIVGAEKEAKVKVVFTDGSSKIVKIPYEVKEREKKEVKKQEVKKEAIKTGDESNIFFSTFIVLTSLLAGIFTRRKNKKLK